MGWARIDDGFDDHPKVLALLEEEQGGAAVGLWTLCLTYAHRTTRKAGKTPGAIPAGLPRRYLGSLGRELAMLLVKVGLWDEAPDGWVIHDFAEYLPSEETRAARSAAGRRGAEKRWADKAQESDGNVMAPSGQDDDKSVADAWLPDSNLPSGSHDVAGKPIANDGSRTPARRDPVPVPEVLPKTPSSGAPKSRRSTKTTEDDSPTAQLIVGEWIERCNKRPPEQVIGQTSKAIRLMLAEGVDANDIRRGVAAWMTKGLHPAALAAVVNEVQNATPRASPPPAAQARAAIPRVEQCPKHPFSRAGECSACASTEES